MTPDSNILLEMFHDDVLVNLDVIYDKAAIKLREPSAGYDVNIYNSPDDAVIVKIDEFPALKEFFKDVKNECRRADYIIISPEKRVVIYVELKGGKKTAEHIITQLKGAACVLAYCSAIGKIFWGNNSFLEGYAHRFVGMVNISINKKPSRKKNGDVHDKPEKFLRISSPHNLQFKELAAL